MNTELDHWQRIYRRREPDEVSWYEASHALSLGLIEEAGLPRDAAILDAGGGASRLAGELLAAGYTDITVADISAEALRAARSELAAAGDRVQWVQVDLRGDLLGRRYDLWHDRAVLHFMVQQADRDAYVATLRRALRPRGHAVIATFGPGGPERCSGLPVDRYGAEQLAALVGDDFDLVSSRTTGHRTPSGAVQQFVYAHLVRTGSAGEHGGVVGA